MGSPASLTLTCQTPVNREQFTVQSVHFGGMGMAQGTQRQARGPTAGGCSSRRARTLVRPRSVLRCSLLELSARNDAKVVFFDRAHSKL